MSERYGGGRVKCQTFNRDGSTCRSVMSWWREEKGTEETVIINGVPEIMYVRPADWAEFLQQAAHGKAKVDCLLWGRESARLCLTKERGRYRIEAIAEGRSLGYITLTRLMYRRLLEQPEPPRQPPFTFGKCPRSYSEEVDGA